jgi:alkylhydroperoxidase family enzyme
VAEVLADAQTSRLQPAEKALFAFLDRVNHHPAEIIAGDLAAVCEAGWPEEAIYDAVTVCALFNFYNRWVDATGVHALPEEAHRAGGKRMARDGYLRTPDETQK